LETRKRLSEEVYPRVLGCIENVIKERKGK